MKKALTYLFLIACFEGFISAAPSCYTQQKVSEIIKTNIELKDKIQQEEEYDINTEIHPLNIFSFRIN